MKIDLLKVGNLQTNCYILTKDEECIIIDPGDEADRIIEKIDKNVVGVVITHSHFDHIGAVSELVDYYHVNKYDKSNLNMNTNKIGSFVFDVIYTPGHLDDLITLYFKKEKVMFVGDFIFEGSIGRVDLEGASPVKMKESILNILKYDDDIKIYPGHGEATTLGKERNNLNHFVKVL